MMKLSILLLAGSFALAGCGKKADSTPSTTPPPATTSAAAGGDCDKAISHSLDLSKEDLAKNGADAAAMTKMHDLGVQHCKDDKWSDDVVGCMVAAKTEADAQTCYGKLTPEQQQKMNSSAGG